MTDRAAQVARCLVAVLLAGAVCAGCQRESSPPRRASVAPPQVSASIVQFRRDEVLRRVEVSVTNNGTEMLHVVRLDLSVPGMARTPSVRKDSPVPPGTTVNLPIAYGEPVCAGASPRVGRARAVLRVRQGTGHPTNVRLVAADPQGVLQRIVTQECLARRLAKEVALSFGSRWRVVAGGGPQAVTLHGTLEVRLNDMALVREITQVGGSVIYDLRPGNVPDVPGGALTRLDRDRPRASLPVIVSAARCDGHARGEAKKPYAFLAWVRNPAATEAQPVAIDVDDRAKNLMQQVCPL